MNSRSSARILLLATATFVGTVASASERTTCPAGRGGEAALKTIGDRSFAPFGARLEETGVTSYCIGCHDGSVSRPVVIGRTGSLRAAAGLFGSATASFDASAMHPVDVTYPDGRRGFRPASEVERVLPLAGGMVTCESCHSGADSTPNRLTVSNEGSRLCLVCHEK
jgi:predicted CXXCH cytochrome family protein